jgi:plastocyanin
MGKPGRIAFPVILALGAVTGYITYTYFTNAIPDPNRIDSPYYEPLSPASGGNITSTGGTNATTSANATTTNATTSNATTQTGGTNATTSANATTGGATTNVSIVPGASSLTDTAFQPNPAQVSVGSTVTWTNNDSQPHTVTSGQNGQPDGKFDSSPNFNPLMTPGATFSHTFTEAGQYPYYCALHPNMVGTVSVS